MRLEPLVEHCLYFRHPSELLTDAVQDAKELVRCLTEHRVRRDLVNMGGRLELPDPHFEPLESLIEPLDGKRGARVLGSHHSHINAKQRDAGNLQAYLVKVFAPVDW